MVTLANGFVERGYDVDLVLASALGPYLTQVSDRVNVVDLGSSYVSLSLPGLIRYLGRNKPTAMLSAMGHANVIALLAARLARVSTRLVVSERCDVSVEFRHRNGFRSRLIRLLSQWLYRNAHHIHAVSAGVADTTAQQLALPRRRIKVVYNPVFMPTLLSLAAEPVEYPWLLLDQRPFIVAAGRLTRQKDFTSLLGAFEQVRRSMDCRLIIMGEGELRESLEREVDELGIEDSVLFPGFVDNPFTVMKRANLFVLSSAWEGLPNVLIQAMACGTPVVSTDCPSGPAEILENGKWGRLVPVGNVEAMAEAMIATLNDKKHPDVESRAAYFSVERAMDGYLRLLIPDATR